MHPRRRARRLLRDAGPIVFPSRQLVRSGSGRHDVVLPDITGWVEGAPPVRMILRIADGTEVERRVAPIRAGAQPDLPRGA